MAARRAACIATVWTLGVLASCSVEPLPNDGSSGGTAGVLADGSAGIGGSSGSSGSAGIGGAGGSGAADASAGTGGAIADASMPPVCGDGKRDDMPCDGTDLGTATCASVIGPGATGTLSCSKYCQLVTTQCSPQGAFGNTSALQAGAPWPMHRHDPRLTGRSPVGVPSSLSIKWTVPLWVAWGIVIDKDGVVYFGSGNTLRAINSDGTEKWKYDAPDAVGSIPLIRNDGSIVFAANDGYVYAVSSAGSKLWSTQVAIGAWALRVAIGGDGTIYATTDLGQIVALTPNGSQKWSYTYAPAGQWVSGMTPAIGPDGTIYVSPSWSNQGVTALNPDGTLKWIYAIPGAESTIHSSVDASGAVIVRWKKGQDSALECGAIALNPDKSEKWSVKMPLPVMDTALGSDGTVYYGWGAWFAPDVLAARKPDGTGNWWTSSGSVPNGGSFVIGADGSVLATLDKTSGVQLMSPLDGSVLKWENLPGEHINMSAMAIAADGRVYVHSNAGLHALGP